MGRKLEIGAGKSRIPGYETSDIIPGCDHLCDACSISSLGKFENLYAGMVLEHLRPWEISIALKDWYEALEIGGTLKITVPDFENIVALFRRNKEEALHRLFGGSLVQGGELDAPEQEHRWAFDKQLLRQYLVEAGFCEIEVVPVDSFLYAVAKRRV